MIIIAVASERGGVGNGSAPQARERWRVPEAGRAPPTRGGASLHRTEVGRSRAGPAISVAPIGRQASVCGARQHRIRPVLLLRAPRPGPLVGCLSASLACRDEAVMRREKKKVGFIFTSISLSASLLVAAFSGGTQSSVSQLSRNPQTGRIDVLIFGNQDVPQITIVCLRE